MDHSKSTRVMMSPPARPSESRLFAGEQWIFGGYIMSVLLLVIGVAVPPFVGMQAVPALATIEHWIQVVFLSMAAVGFVCIILLGLRGVASPWAFITQEFDRQRLISLLMGGLLVALNLAAFGLVKTLLGRFGFRADPLLASIDHYMLGEHGWRTFQWVRHPYIGDVYHAVWLSWILVTLILLLWRRPSPLKNRALIVYFLLWSVIGPTIHLLLPAAGPALSAALTGQDFGNLQIVPSDAIKFNYLLNGYRNGEFNAGGGISAMPSLHIATLAWTVWIWRGWARWVAIGLTIYMWAASVALGWHYLVDGAVSIAVVWLAAAIALQWGHRNRPSFAKPLRA